MTTIDNTWTLDVIVVDPGEAGEFTIDQVDSKDISLDPTEFRGKPAGHGHALMVAIMQMDAKVTFSSSQLVTLLTQLGATGICGKAVDFYFKKKGCKGHDRTATDHIKITAQDGVMFWEQIELPNSSEQNVGTMNCVFQAVWDGTNDLFTVTESVACPGTLTFDEAFVVGDVWVQDDGGTPFGVVNGVQKLTIQNNPTFKNKYSNGQPKPSAAQVEAYDPRIDIETLSSVNLVKVPEDGLKLDGTTGLLAYARRLEPSKTRYANTEAQHIKISAANGLVKMATKSGSGTDDVTDTFQVCPVATNDTTLEITFTTAQQITAPV